MLTLYDVEIAEVIFIGRHEIWRYAAPKRI